MGYDPDELLIQQKSNNKNTEKISLFAMETGLMTERANFWHQLAAHVPNEDIEMKDEL